MREEIEKRRMSMAEDVSDALAGGARMLCLPREAADSIVESYLEQQADPDTADFPAFMRRYGRRSGSDIIAEASSLDGDDRTMAETEILIDMMTALAGISRTPESCEEEGRENAEFFLTEEETEEERKEIEKGELLLDAGIQPGVRNILLSAMPEEEIVSMAETIVARLTDDIGMSRQQIDSLRQIREWARPIGQSPEAEDFDRKTARLILSAAGSPHAVEI